MNRTMNNHSVTQDAESVTIQDGLFGPELILSYNGHSSVTILTEHDMARAADAMAARLPITPVMDAHLERHWLMAAEIVRHLENVRAELRRTEAALGLIEDVFRLRRGLDTKTTGEAPQ